MKYQNEFVHGWGGGQGCSGFGDVGEPAEKARGRLLYLDRLIAQREGRRPRWCEIGCGDFLWHGSPEDGLPGRSYVALDLHRRENWQQWERSGLVRFAEGNAAEIEPFPVAEIYVARQVFIHLSDRIVLRILDRMREASSMSGGNVYLIGSTRPDIQSNAGRFPRDRDYQKKGAPLNLALPPFSLPVLDPPRGVEGGGLGLFSVARNKPPGW